MHKRKGELLSFILAITLFLTGSAFDTADRDAFFLCASMKESTLGSRSAADINHWKICEREILNTCSGMEQQSIELSHLFLILHGNLISLSQKKSYRHSETIPSFCQTPDGLVTNYIHQSDGKKRH